MNQFFGFEVVHPPQRANDAEWDVGIFWKDRQLRAELAFPRIEEFHADLDRAGNGLVTLFGVAVVERHNALLVQLSVQIR